MPADRGEPWGGATYNGFAGPNKAETPTYAAPPPQQRPPAPAWSNISRKQRIIGGVAAAVVLGLAFGLWARTGVHSRDNLSSTAEASVTAKVPIEVRQQTPVVAVQPAGRLDVLPADMAAAARANAPVAVRTVAPRAPAAVDRGANIVAVAQEPLDLAPRPMTREERRAERRAMRDALPPELPLDPRLAPPPEQRLSRAERRAMRDLEPLRADPRYTPPADEDVLEEVDDDPGA